MYARIRQARFEHQARGQVIGGCANRASLENSTDKQDSPFFALKLHMLEHQDELLNIAEISIGIAGFSGLMAAFLQRGGLANLDRVRFVNLFVTAFSTLVLAYVPIVVSELTDSLWFYSSLVMIGVWFFSVGVGVFYVVPAVHAHEQAAGTVPGMLIWIPSLANFFVQLLNVTGWLWETGFLAYLFGLFVYLYAACVMFVFVVIYRPDSQESLE